MKIKLLQVVLMFLAFNSMEANQTLAIDEKQIKKMITTNTLYVIGIDEKCKWNEGKVKVRNFQSIGKGLLEFKFSKLDFSTYKKDIVFVVYSKKDSTSIEFAKRLKELDFKNVMYLKDGKKSWNHVLKNFRGIKLFSIFNS
jgi:hypothetical protein